MTTETVINEFAVLRYVTDTPMHLRVHKHTLGRHFTYDEAVDALDRVPEPCRDYLTIEDRVEEYEVEVDDDDEGEDPAGSS